MDINLPYEVILIGYQFTYLFIYFWAMPNMRVGFQILDTITTLMVYHQGKVLRKNRANFGFFNFKHISQNCCLKMFRV
jgi:hypothetical protein